MIASGILGYSGRDRVSIRYTPAAATVTLSVDGTVIGAFEDVGVLDNFVVRE